MRVVLLFVLSALRPAWLLWRSALKGTCFCLISVRQVLRRTCLEGAIAYRVHDNFPRERRGLFMVQLKQLAFYSKQALTLLQRHGYSFLCWLDFSSFGASRDSIMSSMYFHRTSPRFDRGVKVFTQRKQHRFGASSSSINSSSSGHDELSLMLLLSLLLGH